MPLPFFYTNDVPPGAKTVLLAEENSRHIVQVLRMHVGERLQLTDGNGSLHLAEIAVAHKKNCTVTIVQSSSIPAALNNVTLAISLVKNNTRFEWLLEKAAEIGVTQIVPLLCARTEKQHFRYERMHGILVSAMLQSQQAWLPGLQEPVKYAHFLEGIKNSPQQKFIAHCEKENKQELSSVPLQTNLSRLILIGPEGDFTRSEIDLALGCDFMPVSLGATRLRTETAGMVAAVLLSLR